MALTWIKTHVKRTHDPLFFEISFFRTFFLYFFLISEHEKTTDDFFFIAGTFEDSKRRNEASSDIERKARFLSRKTLKSAISS